MKETYYMQILCGVCNGTGIKPIFGVAAGIPPCTACGGTGIQTVLVTRELTNLYRVTE